MPARSGVLVQIVLAGRWSNNLRNTGQQWAVQVARTQDRRKALERGTHLRRATKSTKCGVVNVCNSGSEIIAH
eukprot:1430363-Alexandrium_andersonii.AAC.1